MTHGFNRMLIWALSILLVGVVLVLPLLNFGAHVYKTGGGRPDQTAAYRSDQAWRTDDVKTGKGISIPVLVRPPAEKSATWIFFIPGNGRGKITGGYEYLNRLDKYFESNSNIGFAVWGMRGVDGVPGRPRGEHIRHDQQQVVAHLMEHYAVSPERLHLVGFSFGTDLSMLLAESLLRRNQPPASLVLLSTQGHTASQWKMRTREWYSLWLPPDRYDLSDALGIIDVPVLVIESKDDLYGNIDFLLDALKPNVNYLELPSGGHGASLIDPQALEATARWILNPVVHPSPTTSDP